MQIFETEFNWEAIIQLDGTFDVIYMQKQHYGREVLELCKELREIQPVLSLASSNLLIQPR